VPDYRAVLVGNVTDKWTKRGQEKEMEALSQRLNAQGSPGWRLHSLQPVPVFGGLSHQQTGVVLLAVYEAN
jgi:hypothetical protein